MQDDPSDDGDQKTQANGSDEWTSLSSSSTSNLPSNV